MPLLACLFAALGVLVPALLSDRLDAVAPALVIALPTTALTVGRWRLPVAGRRQPENEPAKNFGDNVAKRDKVSRRKGI